MTKMSEAVVPFLTLEEQASAAATPDTGNSRLYIRDSDHVLCSVDDAGNVTEYGGALATFRGCKAKIGGTTALTSASTEYAVAFSAADEYDSDAMHDPSSSNTRITVPSALDGRYFVASAYIFVPVTAGNHYLDLKFRKNGAAGTVLAQTRQGPAEGNPIIQLYMSPTVLADGDYVELYAMSDVASRTVDGTVGWFALWVVA